jgi:thiol-disulfide isomerase/thioredoxin
MNLKEKAQKYWKEKTIWTKISDFVFIALIVALIFPASRMQVLVFVKQLTAFSPKAIEKEERKAISITDYNWEFETLGGEIQNMKDFAGKTIFINQWATWCPPCVAEMPSIQKLYDKVKTNKNIVFVIITNEKKETVNAFLKKNGFTFPIVLARSETPKAFESESIPVSFVVSPKGEIVLKEYGSRKWHGNETIKLLNSLK